MKITAVYPGTFDPITNGHVDIIKKASKIFDKLIIAIFLNLKKKPMFNINKRISFAKEVTNKIDNVEVIAFNCLLTDFMKQNKSNVIIRGLRNNLDFNYELKFSHMNKFLLSTIETVFFVSSIEISFLSSSLIKEILYYKGNIKKLVPTVVYEDLLKK